MIDLNTPVGQLRLETGDVGDIVILSDAEYSYILSKYGNSVKDSVIDALYAVLARLSFKTRERLDRIEYFGNQSYEQYKTFVENKIKQLNGTGFVASNFNVYAGGISVEDAEKYKSDSDLIQWHNPLENDNFDWER